MKAFLVKVAEVLLDVLMFIVPVLEMTELIAFIPVEYLPAYMLTTVVLRRVLRFVKGKFDVKVDY